jgi:hypothetical protein
MSDSTAEKLGWGLGPHQQLVEGMATGLGPQTRAAGHFFVAQMELVGFTTFTGYVPEHLDKFLEGLGGGDDSEKRSERIFRAGLDPFRPLLAELLLTRAVDNYLTYVAELLSLVFRAHPEALRSEEKFDARFVLGFESVEELREGIADRKVERLARKGVADLSKWFQDTLGFVLLPDQNRRRLITRLVEKRNLISHRRAVIDRRYLRKCGHGDGELGEVLDARHDAGTAVAELSDAVWDADKRAAKKWGLELEPLPTERRVGSVLPFYYQKRKQSEKQAD